MKTLRLKKEDAGDRKKWRRGIGVDDPYLGKDQPHLLNSSMLSARGQRGSWMLSKILCIPLAKFLTTFLVVHLNF